MTGLLVVALVVTAAAGAFNVAGGLRALAAIRRYERALDELIHIRAKYGPLLVAIQKHEAIGEISTAIMRGWHR